VERDDGPCNCFRFGVRHSGKIAETVFASFCLVQRDAGFETAEEGDDVAPVTRDVEVERMNASVLSGAKLRRSRMRRAARDHRVC